MTSAPPPPLYRSVVLAACAIVIAAGLHSVGAILAVPLTITIIMLAPFFMGGVTPAE